MLVSPLVDVSSDLTADAIRTVSPLPSVEGLLLQDMLWAPVAPQSPDVDDRHATPVPRWRLARQGPFLAERSTDSIRSLGAGCAFRNMTYRSSDYRGSSIFPCITRGFSSGLGFPNRPVLSRWEPDGGWTLFRGIRLWQPPFSFSGTSVYCRHILTFWTSIRSRCRGRHRS